MFLDTVLLTVSGGFAAGLVLTESQMSLRILAVGLFAIQVALFWLVAMPYHEDKETQIWLDNIEIM